MAGTYCPNCRKFAKLDISVEVDDFSMYGVEPGVEVSVRFTLICDACGKEFGDASNTEVIYSQELTNYLSGKGHPVKGRMYCSEAFAIPKIEIRKSEKTYFATCEAEIIFEGKSYFATGEVIVYPNQIERFQSS